MKVAVRAHRGKAGDDEQKRAEGVRAADLLRESVSADAREPPAQSRADFIGVTL